MNAPPDDVKLSREEGDALIERLQANTLTGDDRQRLVKLIRIYFWRTEALRETKISLKRLKRALFGEAKRPPLPSGGGLAGGQWHSLKETQLTAQERGVFSIMP
jgi:hypothetical protein